MLVFIIVNSVHLCAMHAYMSVYLFPAPASGGQAGEGIAVTAGINQTKEDT